MMRPDGAGASWTEKEDQQLGEEFGSGMSISEIQRTGSSDGSFNKGEADHQ